jgi:ankyrin repeat protein
MWGITDAVCLPSREIVEVLVKRELVDVNVKDNRGRTPLFYAALHGRDEYIELLVNYGARVTERADSDLTTPLHWACWAGHAKCVRRLLQERRERDRSYSSVRTRGVLRADPYARDERGRTPLHALMYGACKRGHLRALDVLLRYPNFDVEVYDVRGRTPLHILAQRSTIESQLLITLAQRLLAHGARLDRQDDFGCTALHYAAFAGNEELVRLFVKSNARLWIRDVGGRLPLHYAARRGHLNTLLVLLEAYDHSPTPTNELNVSPLLIPDVKGTTPLHILAQSGHTEVLNSVLGHTTTSLSSSRRSLTLDVTDQRGRTPLHCAVLAGQEPFAMALIRANARTDLRTSSGMSVVHCACASPRPLCSLVRTLLTVSPQLGVLHVDQSQRTPLHFAAAAGNAEIVDLLLSWDKSLRDVMLSQCDSQGRTPLHAVLCRDTPHHRQSLQLILQHASETYGATLKSTFIAREDHAGQTALHYAAALKTTTDFAVDQLLSHGAEVNCPDRRGLRPVHMAIKVKNLAALQRLLTVGGELLNVRDHKNRALVLWACFWLRPSEDLHSFESLHNDPIVQMWDLLLNRYQLDLTATDRSGATCLHYLAWLAPSKVVVFCTLSLSLSLSLLLCSLVLLLLCNISLMFSLTLPTLRKRQLAMRR